jgi:hypothetical protein
MLQRYLAVGPRSWPYRVNHKEIYYFSVANGNMRDDMISMAVVPWKELVCHVVIIFPLEYLQCY